MTMVVGHDSTHSRDSEERSVSCAAYVSASFFQDWHGNFFSIGASWTLPWLASSERKQLEDTGGQGKQNRICAEASGGAMVALQKLCDDK